MSNKKQPPPARIPPDKAQIQSHRRKHKSVRKHKSDEEAEDLHRKQHPLDRFEPGK